MTSNHSIWHARYAIFAVTAILLGGCSTLVPPPPPADKIYLLEANLAPARSATPHEMTLTVGMPRARAGFDSAQMVWVRQPHGLDVYARNRWADTPARMLAPLIVQTLERSGTFRAVVQTPSGVPAGLRLDTEIVRLQQDFSVQPSRVRFTLGVQLIDIGARRVIASTEFDETENAATEDAYGGVLAANRALERLLVRLAAFCAEHTP